MPDAITRLVAWFRTGDRWIPGIFVGLFIALAIWEVTLIRTALSTANGMAQTAAYNKGVEYERVLEIERAQKALGWTVRAQFDQTGPTAGKLRLKVVDRDGAVVPNLRIVGRVERYDGEVRRIPLAFNVMGVGQYKALVDAPAYGRWTALIELRSGSDKTYRLRDDFILPPPEEAAVSEG